MKTIITNRFFFKALLLLMAGDGFEVTAQTSGYALSLENTIALARENNKSVRIAQMEETAVSDEAKDARAAILPQINAAANYQSFTDVTLFEGGLSGAHDVAKRPNANVGNAGVDAAFNVYAGGRQRSLIREADYRKELAAVNTRDQQGSISLQAAAQYLEMVRLYHQQKLIEDQVKRAETRLKNISSLYKNQRVTKSDLLRAELTLSNVLLNKTANNNDLAISNQKLNVLLNLPETTAIIPSDTALAEKPELALLQAMPETKQGSYAEQKADAAIQILGARLSNVKSNYRPSVAFVTAYGLNYPNNLFFPPVDQAYAVGFAGLRVNYNLSSLYHNKNKEAAAKQRLDESKIQKAWLSDNISQETKSMYIKYEEALNRIAVNEKSIGQAKVNYDIINAKYFNQLALLTDLLDADNLYQESRYNYISAQTAALTIYYRLLYITGRI